MNTLFNIAFGGCDMELYIRHPESAKKFLKQDREERGLSSKQILLKRQKEFARFSENIAAISKTMRGSSETS